MHNTYDEPADDRHPVDIIEPEDIEAAEVNVQGIGRIPPDALAVFVRFLIPRKKGTGRWKAAIARLASLAHALAVDGVGELSQTQLAKELGCSRSLLSLLEVELRQFAGLARRGGKSDSARESYAVRAKSIWQRRKAVEAKGDAGRTLQPTEPIKGKKRHYRPSNGTA